MIKISRYGDAGTQQTTTNIFKLEFRSKISYPASKWLRLKKQGTSFYLPHGMGFLSDDEFLLLYPNFISQNLDLPYDFYPPFNLDEMSEDECLAEFRFKKADIPVLAEVLQIPATITCSQGTVCDGVEALCMLLKRMCYPCRYSDMIHLFAKPVPVICMVTNHVMDLIYETHGHRILRWNDELLSPAKLEVYANAVSRAGAPLDNCFGFVDGTVRPIARPQNNQRIVYNGHKRVHAIKFQSVVTPNGIIAHMFGPVEGRKHDAGVDSHLLQDLGRFAFSPAVRPLCIYGDPAYPLRVHLHCPFRNAVLTPQMEQYNAAMSSVRTSVEWLFADIVNFFKFLDFKKNLKLGLSCIGKMYIVCAILQNALTCCYGNQTSVYFQCDPPDLFTYFA